MKHLSTFQEQERRRKLVRQATHGAMESGTMSDMSFSKQQEQIKTGWSLLSTLHCVLLGEKVASLGGTNHKKLLVELLAVKWQDRCLQVSLLVLEVLLLQHLQLPKSQVRIASQELLIAELKNLGEAGRKALVEAWSCYIPKYGDPPFQSSTGTSGHVANGANNGAAMSPSPSVASNNSAGHLLMDEEEEDRWAA